MIGLDTNVLVRLLTADEPVQLKIATHLLAEHEGVPAAFYVEDIVLVELVRVLRRLFDKHGQEVLSAVESLLNNDAFAFEDRHRLRQAVEQCRRQGHDFADTMIALKKAVAAGCHGLVTFDKAMKGLPGVGVVDGAAPAATATITR